MRDHFHDHIAVAALLGNGDVHQHGGWVKAQAFERLVLGIVKLHIQRLVDTLTRAGQVDDHARPRHLLDERLGARHQHFQRLERGIPGPISGGRLAVQRQPDGEDAAGERFKRDREVGRQNRDDARRVFGYLHLHAHRVFARAQPRKVHHRADGLLLPFQPVPDRARRAQGHFHRFGHLADDDQPRTLPDDLDRHRLGVDALIVRVGRGDRRDPDRHRQEQCPQQAAEIFAKPADHRCALSLRLNSLGMASSNPRLGLFNGR